MAAPKSATAKNAYVAQLSSGGGAGCIALVSRPAGCSCHSATPNTTSARPMMPNSFSIMENRILHSTSHTRNATRGIHRR